jgi:hypothetical protein
VTRDPSIRKGTALLAGSILALLLAGCREQVPATMGEIRGEPIHAAGSSNGPAQIAAAQPASTGPASSPQLSAPIGETLKNASGFLSVGFDKLSAYKFEPDEDLLNPQTNRPAAQVRSANTLIPVNVKGFDEKRVSVRGFMLPLKVEGGLVSELLIMRDQSMCCYGVVPKINEWISVKMSGKGVKAIMDQPVTIYGKLHVGEMRENGYLVGIYQLDGEKMETPEN